MRLVLRGGGILPPRLLPCLLGWEAGRLRHELHDLANNFQLAPPANVEQLFSFDAGGSRARQIKTRTALTTGAREYEVTEYLGTYEREVHSTSPDSTTTPVTTKTLHRHNLGAIVYTRAITAAGTIVKLTNVLADHLGSTDFLLTSTWDQATKTFSIPTGERQAFDPWGERANPTTAQPYRQSDADPFRRSSTDYDRGYTGHEQLDDSGLIHMNGRLYDPELGRMLSADPYVQVPEYSQNFNRYSYVLNNPLNKTDPTGYSWLGNVFHKLGSWLKENWRTVVVIIVAAILTIATAGIATSAAIAVYGATSSVALASTAAYVAWGAAAGALTGAFSAAISGGDILRGALIGGITGALGGALGGYGSIVKALGGAVASGVGNVAMGGKFQDGFMTSLKYSAIFAAGREVGRMASSYLSKDNINGRANMSRGGEGMPLNNSGYKAQRMWYDTENHFIDPSKLDVPDGWKYEENGYYQDPQGVSNLDYATFVNHSKGIRLMSMIGTQNDRGGVDWLDDVKQALGFPTKQYFRAMDLALKEQAISQKMGYSFMLSGHSLGGGLAAAASAVTGAPALVYNAAGVNPLTLLYAGYGQFVSRLGSNVTSYSVGGEILTSGQFALSSIIPTVSSQNHYTFWPRDFPFSTWNPGTLHGAGPTVEAVR